MYEHYKPAQQIFVDREEYLSWMEYALKSCRDKSLVLHLKGIGGIGKSTLLNYWTRTIEKTVRLDCQQYTEFYSRLDVIAKGAVRIGINLKRFDILWHIRKRFVEGVEPATEKGREWAKEVLVAIPFIGSLASIGSAIKSVGDTVAPKIRQRYGEAGQWLQDRLGSDYLERLLEILWKEPQHAEFLYLDALLEDINSRKNLDTPLLFLFDHSENVDEEEKRWNYAGKMITEMELWYVFVSSLKNCVGVVASRRAVPQLTHKALDIEEKEIIELDSESCLELLSQRSVTDPELQKRIVSISGGNPFVINAICDVRETTEISINDIEDLRAETLDEVRLKTWRRLFSDAKDLLNLVDRAGLLPSFDKDSMNIVAPGLKTDQWERMIRLSFVKPRSNGSWVLHDLARDLVRAELGTQLNSLVTDVSELLKKASAQNNDPALLGIALSVIALDSDQQAMDETKSLIQGMIKKGEFNEALLVLDNLVIQSLIGEAFVQGYRGIVCNWLKRYAEAEFPLREAIRIFEETTDEKSEWHLENIGTFTSHLGDVLNESSRHAEAEPEFEKALEMAIKLAESEKEEHVVHLIEVLNGFAWLHYRSSNSSEGVKYAKESLDLARRLNNPGLLVRTLNVAAVVLGNIGQFHEQKQLYQESIDIVREQLRVSPDSMLHKATLAAYLGNYIFCLQNNEEIEEAFSEVLRLGEEIADFRPTNVGYMKMRYGWHCLKNYRFHEAEQYLKEALRIYSEYGEKEPQAAFYWIYFVTFLLIELYLFNGRFSQAREYIERLPPIKAEDTALLSDAELIGLIGKHAISGLYNFMINQIEIAEREFHTTLNLIDQLTIDTSEEVQIVASILNNCCIFFGRMGKYDEAEKVFVKAREILRFIKSHWAFEGALAITNSNYALTLHSTSNFAEAEKYIEDSIDFSIELLPKMPSFVRPLLVRLENNLAVVKNALKKSNDALGILQETLDTKRELIKMNPGAFRPSLATTLNNLGIILYKVGKKDEAEYHLREALNIRHDLVRKNPEVYSLDLASTLHNLALFLSKEGKNAESDKLLSKAIQIRKEHLELGLPFLGHSKEEILDREIWSEELEPIYLSI
ncbi:MAG: tetratricopeptide repeat protein [Candidatus Sifarchaeia archaeon]